MSASQLDRQWNSYHTTLFQYVNATQNNIETYWEAHKPTLFEYYWACKLKQVRYADLPLDLLRQLYTPGKSITCQDLGIDLIDPCIQQTGRRVNAVTQVKHYEKATITWGHMATFLLQRSIVAPDAKPLLATLEESKISCHV